MGKIDKPNAIAVFTILFFTERFSSNLSAVANKAKTRENKPKNGENLLNFV